MQCIRARVLATALLCVVPHSAIVAQGPARHADLVLLGGKVFTADSTRPLAEAIAVAQDRVLAVGTTAEIRRLVGPRTLVYDLGGRVVVPGFNDAHMHLSAGVPGTFVPVGRGPLPDPPLAALADSLSTAAARTPPGSWLVAGAGLSVFSSATPLREVFDHAAPNHLVLVYSEGTGHGYALNSAALTSLRYADTTPDPAGGWFERDSSGRLTGVVQEYAGWTVFARLNRRLPDSQHVAAVKEAIAEGLKFGITSMQHMANVAPPEAVLRSIRDAAPPIRYHVIRMPLPDAGGSTTEWLAAGAMALPRTVRVAGWKWILDGTPRERLALMREPYADRPGWYGRLDFPVDTIRRFLRDALRTSGPDGQLMLHVAGDSTAALVLHLMTELAPDSVWRSRRLRFEHGDGLMPDLRPLARRLGVIVVQNPAHFAAAGLSAARLGDTRARQYQGLRSLVAAGIPLAIGSDGLTNPFLNILLASTHPNNPSEALSREQVAIAYTRGSAYAEFAEEDKGRLVPGQLADLAVLTQDIFTVEATALPKTRSILTLIGGRVAYDAGVLRPVR